MLQLPTGTFPFGVQPAPGISIEDINAGAGGLTIRGAGTGDDGTRLVFDVPEETGTAWQVCFLIRGSQGITLEKMEITRSRLSSTQGTVESIGASTIRFRLHEGYPDRRRLSSPGPGAMKGPCFPTSTPAAGSTLSPYATKYHVLRITEVAGQKDCSRLKSTRPGIDARKSRRLGKPQGQRQGERRYLYFEDTAHCTVRDVRVTRASCDPSPGWETTMTSSLNG